ncbi:MAG: hypothetical protein FWE43_02640 [Streptococcaceae bacterium]|nr:hypothetical protein [Streptococcaceae bacterium]
MILGLGFWECFPALMVIAFIVGPSVAMRFKKTSEWTTIPTQDTTTKMKIATIGEGGKDVYFSNGVFTIDEQVTLHDQIVEYDHLGVLVWTNGEVRKWSLSEAALTSQKLPPIEGSKKESLWIFLDIYKRIILAMAVLGTFIFAMILALPDSWNGLMFYVTVGLIPLFFIGIFIYLCVRAKKLNARQGLTVAAVIAGIMALSVYSTFFIFAQGGTVHRVTRDGGSSMIVVRPDRHPNDGELTRVWGEVNVNDRVRFRDNGRGFIDVILIQPQR